MKTAVRHKAHTQVCLFNSGTTTEILTSSPTNNAADSSEQNIAIPIGVAGGVIVVATAAAGAFYFIKKRRGTAF